MPYIEPDHPVLDSPQPALDTQPTSQPRKEELKEPLSADLSPTNLFSSKSKSKIPNMLTDAGPKKEFMNTMFIEGADDRREQKTRSLESELPWFDGNKAMNL